MEKFVFNAFAIIIPLDILFTSYVPVRRWRAGTFFTYFFPTTKLFRDIIYINNRKENSKEIENAGK